VKRNETGRIGAIFGMLSRHVGLSVDLFCYTNKSYGLELKKNLF